VGVVNFLFMELKLFLDDFKIDSRTFSMKTKFMTEVKYPMAKLVLRTLKI
jgi:hypothetical protein